MSDAELYEAQRAVIDAACVNLSDSVDRAINAIRGEVRRLEDRNEAERAVLLAAKRFIDKQWGCTLRDCHTELAMLGEAVRALAELKKVQP